MSVPIPPPPPVSAATPPPAPQAATPPVASPPPAPTAPPPVAAAPPPVASPPPVAAAPPPVASPPPAPTAPPQIAAAPTAREPITIDAEPVSEMVPYAPAEELPVPVTDVNWSGSFEEIAAQQGFEDLDFTAFGIWPICSLDRGVFKLSTGGNLGTEFYAQIQQKRKKTLYDNGIPLGQKGSAAVYSYDGETTNGKPLKPILDSWEKVGKREYVELVCKLQDERIVLLSVPPQSISRFVAFVAETITARIPVAQAWCRVHIGPRVEKAAVPFDPIAFQLIRG